MELRERVDIGVPARWVLCFARRSSRRTWIARLTPGRYVHVCAFGHVPEMDLWIFYDVQYGRTLLGVARGSKAREIMDAWTWEADMVGINRLGDCPSIASRLGFWCGPAIRHLIGLPGGAILPASLYRDCLRHGGVPVA